MDHMLVCEIDVELARLDDAAARLVWWFQESVGQLAAAARQEIESGPKLPPEAIRRPMPCGPPGAMWGFVSVGHDGKPAKPRVYTAKNMQWLLGELAKVPTSAKLQFSPLDTTGYPDDPTISVEFRREDACPDWGRLILHTMQSQLADPAYQARLLAVLRDLADDIGPSFGYIDHTLAGILQTGHEANLMPGPLPRTFLPESRTYLRGYSWLTICPQDIADRLGGPEALHATGAFANVVPLRNGGLWLLATPDFADYDYPAAERVWRALAPALRPGPVAPPEPDDPTLQHVVRQDAATLGAT